MITENSILSELYDRGYEPTVNDVIKNGVVLRGLTMKDESTPISPCIYLDTLLDNCDSPAQAAEKIITIYESNRAVDLGFDIHDITDPEFIKSHVYIGVQKTSDENIAKRPSIYEGIEEFLYLRSEKETSDGNRWSIKVKNELISEMDTEELWKLAEERTFKGFQIISLGDILLDMGFQAEEDVLSSVPMFVITNQEKYKGAALACDLEAIKKWSTEHGYNRIVILPSSVHEMLLVPITDDDYDLDTFSRMVADVNASTVDPVDQLTNKAYLVNF